MPLINSDLFRAFGRLGQRLRLKDAPVASGVSSDVIPITDFDELLRQIKVWAATQDISAGSGSTVFFTVPSGKRWRVLRLEISTGTSGSSKAYYRVGGSSGQAFDLWPSGTDAVFFEGHGDPLDQGDEISMVNTGNGADNARELVCYYTEEDAF